MEWKVITDKLITCKPYRIEKVRHKWYLYKNQQIEGRWSLKILGKWEYLEDAKKAADDDSRQMSLWG